MAEPKEEAVDVRWDVLTIGHLSRNRYWGEADDRAYREPLCTSTLIRTAALIRPSGTELIPGIRVIATLGHSVGHASLVFESEGMRVVVAGDAAMTRDFFRHNDYYFNTVIRRRRSPRSRLSPAGPTSWCWVTSASSSTVVRGSTKGSTIVTRTAGDQWTGAKVGH